MGRLSRNTFAILGIMLGLAVVGMAWSIINTALSSIQKDLSASFLQLQWVMNIFGIFICVPLLAMGKLGDAYGRKKLFLIGLLGCGCASFIAGFATHIQTIIASQALFGLSSAVILPLSQALMVHQFPESQKEKAIGIWGTFASLSLAVGPLVGGAILHFFTWRWVFLINVPVVILAFILVFFLVKKEKPEKTHCDWKGIGLLMTVVSALVIAIVQGPSWGWTSIPLLGLVILALFCLYLFQQAELQAKSPLFRPDLFAQPSFLFSSIGNACLLGFIWSVFFFVPLYLQNVLNYSPLLTGSTLLFTTMPVALFSLAVSKIYKKIGAKPLLILGFLLLMAAALGQALDASFSSPWWIAVSCLFIGFGWVLCWGPSTSYALSSIPHRSAGMASGMFTTLQEFGGNVGLAIAGVLFRVGNAQILKPHQQEINTAFSSLPQEQVPALLANPKAAATYLGEGSPLLPSIQKAFLWGYREAMWFLVVFAAIAILFCLLLPKKKKTTD